MSQREFEAARAILEAETDRCWDWVYDLMPCPAQALAIHILEGHDLTPMRAEELWALVRVAVDDPQLPHPGSLF